VASAGRIFYIVARIRATTSSGSSALTQSHANAANLLTRSYSRQLLWQRLQRRNCSWPKSNSPFMA